MKDYYEQFKLLVNSYIILENKFYKFKDVFDKVVRLYNNELQENERLKRKIKELINKHE